MGGRERWSALVVPSLLGPASAGVLLMSSKTKIAAALACLLLLVAGGVAGWKIWSSDEEAPRSSSLEGKMTPHALPSSEPKEKRDEPPAQAAEPAAPPATATAPAPQGIQARVHVTDEQGQDVAGASVAAVQVANPDLVTTGTTDASGEALLDLPGAGPRDAAHHGGQVRAVHAGIRPDRERREGRGGPDPAHVAAGPPEGPRRPARERRARPARVDDELPRSAVSWAASRRSGDRRRRDRDLRRDSSRGLVLPGARAGVRRRLLGARNTQRPHGRPG